MLCEKIYRCMLCKMECYERNIYRYVILYIVMCYVKLYKGNVIYIVFYILICSYKKCYTVFDNKYIKYIIYKMNVISVIIIVIENVINKCIY